MDNEDALTQPWEEPFYLCTAYSLSAARRTDLLLLPTWFWEVVNLLVDSLGWLCFVEFGFQVAESTVAAQNFNSLLLDSGRSDSKILQTRESWVPHVCEVKLEKQKFKHSVLQVEEMCLSIIIIIILYRSLKVESPCRGLYCTLYLPNSTLS